MTQDEQARLWVERLRAGYEAFNREEFDESLEFMHPDMSGIGVRSASRAG